jgi:hypothetical protein
LLVSVVVATGCGGGEETLRLRAEGPSTVEVEYTISDEDPVTETVQSPWRLEVGVSGDWSVDLVVHNPTTGGDVICALEGEAIRRAVGTRGEASAHCRASKSGHSISYEVKGEPFPETSSTTSAPTGPIQRLPVSLGFVREITVEEGRLYMASGNRILVYDPATDESSELAAQDPSADFDHVVVGSSSYGLDVGPGVVYRRRAGTTLEPLATVAGASDLVLVGDEVWVPAHGDGASEQPGIVRFSAATGKRIGRVPGYTDVLAVGPDAVLAQHDSSFAILSHDGRVVSTGSPAMASIFLTAAFLSNGKVVVGTRDGKTIYLLDTATWEATPVSTEFEVVHSDGAGGAVVEHLFDDRIAKFDVAAGAPAASVSPLQQAAITELTPETIWMRTEEGSLYRVDRSVLG